MNKTKNDSLFYTWCTLKSKEKKNGNWRRQQQYEACLLYETNDLNGWWDNKQIKKNKQNCAHFHEKSSLL